MSSEIITHFDRDVTQVTGEQYILTVCIAYSGGRRYASIGPIEDNPYTEKDEGLRKSWDFGYKAEKNKDAASTQ